MFGLSFLTPQILGAIGIALIATLFGGWATHKYDGIALSKAQAETASVNASYSQYRASVLANAAKADADTLQQKQAQDAKINDLQTQLLTSQKAADAKSAQLRAILDKAAPGDIKPIGNAARAYYDGLRGTPASAPSAPANH